MDGGSRRAIAVVDRGQLSMKTKWSRYLAGQRYLKAVER